MTSAVNEYAARLEEHLKQETPASQFSPDAAVAPEFSEDALALRFSSLHPDLRHTDKLKTWHRWTGTYWKADSTLQIYDEIRASVREVASAIVKRLETIRQPVPVVVRRFQDRAHGVNTAQQEN
jgi:hypothetical protein